MHTLTNTQADRLASDLDRAATHAHELAAWHSRYASGLTIVGDARIAEYHERAAFIARADAHTLSDYAEALRERRPLWDPPLPEKRARLASSTRSRQIEARASRTRG